MRYINCFSIKSKVQIFFYLSLLIFSSCKPARDLTYFSDLDQQKEYSQSITNLQEARIQANDLLSIVVTSLSPEANSLFNRGAMPAVGTSGTAAVSGYANSNSFNESYLVDKNGQIDFPVLGKITVAGLTRNQAKDIISKQLEKYLKEPIVYVRQLNFSITVIGEVKSPATFSIPSERINILEALGKAGDMTPYGRRDNVLVIREQEGQRTLARLNLNSKEVINSPYFYLRQNDVVYVEAHALLEERTNNADRNVRFFQIALSSISLIIIIITQLSNN
jgi:polysaccharide export outer membrane protein